MQPCFRSGSCFRRFLITALALLGAVHPSVRAAIPGDPVASCEQLDGAARGALQSLLEEYFPPPDTVSCGMHTIGNQIDVLTRQRDRAIPCLLAMHRGDLRKTKLWRRADPVPDVRLWSAQTIGLIDPVLAIRLHREMLTTASTRWDQLSLRLTMIQFGDRSSLNAVVSILRDLDVRTLTQARQGTVLEAIYVLVRYDDRDVLPSLRAAQSAVGAEREYLGAWVAQLERDVPTLERYAKGQGTWSFALDSLARVGARDVLERLAADPKFYGRENARMLLSKGLPPLPAPVNADSECSQLDEKGRRELMGWLQVRFPPRGVPYTDCGTESLPFALMSQREIASTCIEDIYRRGTTGAGLWKRSEPNAYPGLQILGLLGSVDPQRAARLWREWGESPGQTDWQRALSDWNRVLLGDRDGIAGLVSFLRATLDTPRDAPNGPGYLLEESAGALIQVDHRPAVSLLGKWRERGYLRTSYFDVGLARLARDPATLEKLARNSDQATYAIEALGFINARDSLRRLADDPNFRYRYQASQQIESRH